MNRVEYNFKSSNDYPISDKELNEIHISHISQTHEELLAYIFSLLDADSQRSASLVSRKWNEIASSRQVLNRPGHAEAIQNCAAFMNKYFHKQLSKDLHTQLKTITNLNLLDAEMMNKEREHLLSIMETLDYIDLRNIIVCHNYKDNNQSTKNMALLALDYKNLKIYRDDERNLVFTIKSLAEIGHISKVIEIAHTHPSKKVKSAAFTASSKTLISKGQIEKGMSLAREALQTHDNLIYFQITTKGMIDKGLYKEALDLLHIVLKQESIKIKARHTILGTIGLSYISNDEMFRKEKLRKKRLQQFLRVISLAFAQSKQIKEASIVANYMKKGKIKSEVLKAIKFYESTSYNKRDLST